MSDECKSQTQSANPLLGLRLNQALAYSGLCSRKAAARLIATGQVLVNQQLQPHHYIVKAGDHIRVAGQPLPTPPARQYWLYHKPVGIDCNVKLGDPQSIAQLLAELPVRLFPLGRLDKDSSGLLLLSNDGALSQQLMHATTGQQKHYVVGVDQAVQPQLLQQLCAGVQWQIGPHTYHSKPCQVTQQSTNQLLFTLTEGQNRQIRYMCRAVGLRVITLHRFGINDLRLSSADVVGTCRPLTAAELRQLQAQPDLQEQADML
jgi:16S rRNA pseudouridine516 synthase